MTINLDQIKTIVVVMMENRSFDHFLGYMNLARYKKHNSTINGLQDASAWLDSVANKFNSNTYRPFMLDNPYQVMPADPPHERPYIKTQMGDPDNGKYPLNGFVASYAEAPEKPLIDPDHLPAVMGYFTPEHVPVTNFFAENFVVCDNWFSSIPAGTQPNRLMAMSGYSRIDTNQTFLPDQYLIYDWLKDNGIRWKVYHQTLPFFSMMPRWIPNILGEENFSPFDKLFDDVENLSPSEFPQVIFIEPAYTSAPHIGSSSDDHAPSAIRDGQAFLSQVYIAMTKNPQIWNESVMIVTYDEHGGFFDHVSPPAVITNPSPDATYTESFASLGVRVPAFIISPFVEAGTVFNGLLDHTSILKFIGEKFSKSGIYSDIVGERKVGSVSEILTDQKTQKLIPIIDPFEDYFKTLSSPAGYIPGSKPPDILAVGFQEVLHQIGGNQENNNGFFDELLSHFPPQVEGSSS